jgi:hypothetical protein
MLRPSAGTTATPRARVSADKTFTLKNVAPAHYDVTLAGYPETCYVKTIRFGGQAAADGVDISGGGTLEIVLSAAAGEIAATVLDGDGKPAGYSTVALIASDGPFTRSATADENGSVLFRGLKPGDYRVMAWEDIEPGAWQDPDFRKPFEGRGESVKLDPGSRAAARVKVIPASETDR